MFTKEKVKPTFASAMATFTQAQEELKEAGQHADEKLAETEKAWTEAKTEKQNVDRVSAFFANLLQGN